MIRRRWTLAMLLLPLTAGAISQRHDDAQQWPLQLSEPAAGAYRVVLDEAVYRRVQRASPGDIEVFNAQGQSVPAAVLEADVRLAAVERLPPLPWFPLPAATMAADNDLKAITERDADGSVRRVDIRVQDGRAAPAPASGVPMRRWRRRCKRCASSAGRYGSRRWPRFRPRRRFWQARSPCNRARRRATGSPGCYGHCCWPGR